MVSGVDRILTALNSPLGLGMVAMGIIDERTIRAAMRAEEQASLIVAITGASRDDVRAALGRYGAYNVLTYARLHGSLPGEGPR